MFTPWNLYPARNVDTNSHIETECFNLLKPDGTIPLGFTPRAPLNRVQSGCSTGVESLGLFPWGSMLHPLCAMLSALCAMPFTSCAMLAISPGLGNALSRFYIKSSISSEGGWSFFMSILVNDTCC